MSKPFPVAINVETYARRCVRYPDELGWHAFAMEKLEHIRDFVSEKELFAQIIGKKTKILFLSDFENATLSDDMLGNIRNGSRIARSVGIDDGKCQEIARELWLKGAATDIVAMYSDSERGSAITGYGDHYTPILLEGEMVTLYDVEAGSSIDESHRNYDVLVLQLNNDSQLLDYVDELYRVRSSLVESPEKLGCSLVDG